MTEKASAETSEGEVIKLTRRRALGALGTVGIGGAIAGAGTFATFSDSGVETGGFDAGTLSLTTGGTSSLNFNAGNIEPGDSGTSTADLSPSGTLTDDLTPSVDTVDGTAGEDGTADLQDALEFKMWLDQGGTDDGTYDTDDIALLSDGTADSGTAPAWDVASNYNAVSWGRAIQGMGSDWSFHLDWRLPDTAGNEAQGDGLDVEFGFTLEQQS